MAKKTKIERRDRMIDRLSKIGYVPLYDGDYDVEGRRVLSQEGSLAPINKALQRKENLREELADRLANDPKHYPAYVYALNDGAVEPGYEIPQVNLCNQFLDDVKAHLPYHVLTAQELGTALRITPMLLSANIVGIWNEFGWAEKEFLVDKKENKFPVPLALYAAMRNYIANPAKYAEGKCKVVDSIKKHQDDRSKHIVELKKLQRRLMDYYEPCLLADVVDEIMSYKPRTKHK